MSRSRSLQHCLPALILVGSLFLLYLSTLAPGLTWAHEGSDGGDLIAAAATGGVPHPTGYPLYLLMARVFQAVPVGSLAFRTNLLSAVATALAAGVIYGLVANGSAASPQTHNWPAGLAAGYAFGLAPLVWSQAVITEVYGLQALLVAVILFLYSRPAVQFPSAQARLDRWRGLTLGLAMGNHLTTLLLVPAALVLGCVHRRTPSRLRPSSLSNLTGDGRALLRQVGMFAAGMALYLTLPLRAMANPPVNWGNVVTPERFWWLVSGELYRSYYLHFHLAETLERIQTAAALLLEQFGLPGVIFAVVGLILYGTRSRLSLLTIWTAVVSAVFAGLYGSHDSYIYLMPVIVCFAIWMGLFFVGLSDRFARGSSVLWISSALLLTGYLAFRAATHVSQLDATTDLRAESFGREVLAAAPEDALLFATGDRAVFTLWYFHFALGERPDLAVIAVELLHFDWYAESLRSTYPSLVVPAPFAWAETVSSANPARPACYVQGEDGVALDCSPPPLPP